MADRSDGGRRDDGEVTCHVRHFLAQDLRQAHRAADFTAASVDFGWAYHSPAPGVYPSYDYGAAITEGRQLTDKYSENKKIGYFLSSVKDILETALLSVGDHDAFPHRFAGCGGALWTAGRDGASLASSPVISNLIGSVDSTYDVATGDLRLNYAHGGLIIVGIGGSGVPLLLAIADDAAAATFWRVDVGTIPVLIQGPSLKRTVSMAGNTIEIASWSFGDGTGGLGAVSLAVLGNVAGGVPVTTVNSPSYSAIFG